MSRPKGFVVSEETKAKIAASRRRRDVERSARVIALLHEGLSRAAVAERMCISVYTVGAIVRDHKRALAASTS